jgi:hypothetical protein
MGMYASVRGWLEADRRQRAELVLGDGLALLPLAVLMPDRPPPAPLVPGGYTVIPRSSSMTSPSPRVAAWVSMTATRLAAFGMVAAALRARLAAARASCGDSVGI